MAPLALLLAAALRSPLLAAAADVGLRAQYFSNSALLEPACAVTEPSPAALRLDAKALAARCGGKLSPELFSSRFHGSLHLPAGQYQMKLETTGALRFCAQHNPSLSRTPPTTPHPARSHAGGWSRQGCTGGSWWTSSPSPPAPPRPSANTISRWSRTDRSAIPCAWTRSSPRCRRSSRYRIARSGLPRGSRCRRPRSGRTRSRSSSSGRTCSARSRGAGTHGTGRRPPPTCIFLRPSALTSRSRTPR